MSLIPSIPTQMFLTLQRYAGWLNRDRPSVVVRADVAALGLAISSGLDTRAPLDAVDEGLKRLPGGSMKKMLRATAAKVRGELEATPVLEQESGNELPARPRTV